ncbi:MAG: hypothetical protein AB7S54_09660 [Bacteroidales bacterium]
MPIKIPGIPALSHARAGILAAPHPKIPLAFNPGNAYLYANNSYGQRI